MHFIKKALNSYKNLSVQVKASLWFVVCNILQKGISLITVPIFTRMMTSEQYGYFSTYVSWYNVLLVFTSLSLYYGVFNNAMMRFKDDRPRFISSIQGLIVVLTSFVFILYLCIREPANRFLELKTPMVLMLFAELLVTPALQFWSAHHRYEFKYHQIVAVTIAKSVLNPLLGIILVHFSEDKTLARISSVVIVEVCFCSIIAIMQFIRGKAFFDKKYWKYALLFNLPLIPHYLSGQILNQSDRIMIGKLIDQSSVAKYSVAYNIGLLMNILTNAINGSYTPWFYQKFAKNGVRDIRRISTAIMLMMASFVTILMFFGPELLRIIAPAEYWDARYVIPTVAASVFFTFMYNIFANFEFYYEKNQYVMIGSVIAALTNIGLNFVFIPLFGYIAASYTTLTCYIIYCGMHFFFAMYLCRKNQISSEIINKKLFLITSAAVVCIAILMNFIYLNSIVRYSMIAAIVLAILFKFSAIKNLIFSILGEMKSKSKKKTAETQDA